MQHRKSTKIRRKIDTNKTFQEARSHIRFPPKSLFVEPFHRNFIGMSSFVPNDYIEKFPIGFESSKILLFSLCSKEDINVFPCLS